MRRVALVTGGARGIGAAVCQELARAGYSVAISYTASADKAERMAEELRSQGMNAMAVKADVRDRAAVEAMFAEVKARMGAVERWCAVRASLSRSCFWTSRTRIGT